MIRPDDAVDSGPAPDSAVFSRTRIVLRPIGSPLTVGMSGLAIASLVESGLALQWIASSQTRQVGVILMAVPFVLQLLACVFSFLARDGATGACVGILSTTWLAIGLLHLLSTGAHRGGALGLLLLAASGVLALSASAVSRQSLLTGVVFLLAALRFALAGVYDLGAATAWQHASGMTGLIVCATASYSVLAFELEGQQGRPVLPTFRRARGRVAIRGDLETQLDHIGHEAGVRQTS